MAANDLLLADVAPYRDFVLRLRFPEEGGRYPLIVFSHGAMSSPARYDLLADHWASHGYVVIMPTHLDSPALGLVDPGQMGLIFDTRKSDMSLVVDLLDQIVGTVPDLFGKIDSNRIAAAGHSMGALVAMAVTGLATKNAEAVVEPMSDGRFDLAILLSGPGEMPVIPEESWSAYDAPALLVTGTKDVSTFNRDNPEGWKWHLAAFDKTPPGGKFALIVADLEHSLGGLICCDAPNQGLPDHEGLSIVSDVTTLYLDAHLRDDVDAREALTQDSVNELSKGRAELRMK